MKIPSKAIDGGLRVGRPARGNVARWGFAGWGGAKWIGAVRN